MIVSACINSVKTVILAWCAYARVISVLNSTVNRLYFNWNRFQPVHSTHIIHYKHLMQSVHSGRVVLSVIFFFSSLFMSYRFQTVFLCVFSFLFDIIVTANTSTDADIPFFASYFLTYFLFQLERKNEKTN